MNAKLRFPLVFMVVLLGCNTNNNNDNPFHDDIEIEYFDNNNTLPKRMEITGEIVGITTGTSCGIFLSSGTLKIRSREGVVGYSDSIIYIVVPCLSKGESIIGNVVSLTVLALYVNNTECYKPIYNKFDSNGTPFYWLNQAERKKFYQQLNK